MIYYCLEETIDMRGGSLGGIPSHSSDCDYFNHNSQGWGLF